MNLFNKRGNCRNKSKADAKRLLFVYVVEKNVEMKVKDKYIALKNLVVFIKSSNIVIKVVGFLKDFIVHKPYTEIDTTVQI